MQRLSAPNKVIIALILSFMFVIAIVFVISEFSIYRADTLSEFDKADSLIIFMPFSRFKSNINGEELKGNYERKLMPNGDYAIEFRLDSGKIAFTALYYGDTLQVDSMRFKRTL